MRIYFFAIFNGILTSLNKKFAQYTTFVKFT